MGCVGLGCLVAVGESAETDASTSCHSVRNHISNIKSKLIRLRGQARTWRQSSYAGPSLALALTPDKITPEPIRPEISCRLIHPTNRLAPSSTHTNHFLSQPRTFPLPFRLVQPPTTDNHRPPTHSKWLPPRTIPLDFQAD